MREQRPVACKDELHTLGEIAQRHAKPALILAETVLDALSNDAAP
jgi:hypothetical protein